MTKIIKKENVSNRKEFKVWVKQQYPDLDGLPLDYLTKIFKDEFHPLQIRFILNDHTVKGVDGYIHIALSNKSQT